MKYNWMLTKLILLLYVLLWLKNTKHQAAKHREVGHTIDGFTCNGAGPFQAPDIFPIKEACKHPEHSPQYP